MIYGRFFICKYGTYKKKITIISVVLIWMYNKYPLGAFSELSNYGASEKSSTFLLLIFHSYMLWKVLYMLNCCWINRDTIVLNNSFKFITPTLQLRWKPDVVWRGVYHFSGATESLPKWENWAKKFKVKWN